MSILDFSFMDDNNPLSVDDYSLADSEGETFTVDENWFSEDEWDANFDTSFLLDGLGETDEDKAWWESIVTPENITGAIGGAANGYAQYQQQKAYEDRTDLSQQALNEEIATKARHNASINQKPGGAKRAILVRQ